MMSSESYRDGSCTGRRDVLLADDDEGLRIVLSIALRGKGFAVDVAADGGEAIRKCEEGRYEWIIADMDMSSMCGLDLVRQIKTISPSVKVVLITAGTPLPHSGSVQIEHVFEKPVDAGRMAHYLKNFGSRDFGV